MKQHHTGYELLSDCTSDLQKSVIKKRTALKSIVPPVLILLILLAVTSCKTTPVDPMIQKNAAWLAGSNGELFRVVMMSNAYIVSQKNYTDKISRAEDTGGDEFFMERLRRYDIVDREVEGMIRVQLYPNTGRLMKIRFLQSTYITEIDKMITDDIQRWTFNFNGPVTPRSFSIRYRVVLRKRSAADDSMQKEVQQELQKQRRRR